MRKGAPTSIDGENVMRCVVVMGKVFKTSSSVALYSRSTDGEGVRRHLVMGITSSVSLLGEDMFAGPN